MGGTEKLTSLKDEYKNLVEQNYELYEQIKGNFYNYLNFNALNISMIITRL